MEISLNVVNQSSYQLQKTQVVCTPLWHQYWTNSHHTLYPTSHSDRLQYGPHLHRTQQQVCCLHACKLNG